MDSSKLTDLQDTIVAIDEHGEKLKFCISNM